MAQEILQTMGLRSFTPMVSACPGCGRTTSTFFQELADKIQGYLRDQMPAWRARHPGVEEMHVAVMGCVVNGPGESKLANVGISLPGSGETPVAPVYVDGKKTVTLKGDQLKLTATANDNGNIIKITLTADCAITKDGTIHGIITGCDVDVSGVNVLGRVTLRVPGKHNVYNSLAAVAVGLECGMTLKETTSALATFAPPDKRGEVVRVGNISAINDCYNSNPKALAAMVDVLAAMPATRRIVIAGEMLELGAEGEQMHRDSGGHIARKGIDVLIGVRGLAGAMVDAAKQHGMRAEFVTTPEEAGDWLGREVRDGDVVLLKASRSVKLEKALERWQSASQKAFSSRPTSTRNER